MWPKFLKFLLKKNSCGVHLPKELVSLKKFLRLKSFPRSWIPVKVPLLKMWPKFLTFCNVSLKMSMFLRLRCSQSDVLSEKVPVMENLSKFLNSYKGFCVENVVRLSVQVPVVKMFPKCLYPWKGSWSRNVPRFLIPWKGSCGENVPILREGGREGRTGGGLFNEKCSSKATNQNMASILMAL